MTPPADTPTERARVAALRRLGVLDRPRRDDLDALARLAAHVCGVGTAAVNLIDADRQWSAAAFGWEPPEFDRCDSLCDVAIRTHDVSHTRNAATDPRWAGNPFTDGRMASIRFYAAAPLILAGGEVIGTLCTFDGDERDLDRTQIERLRDLAALTVRLLELQDEAHRLGDAALRDPLTGLPNRALLAETLAHSLDRARRGTPAPVVLFCDVNGFKQVNDEHGHATGDALLRELARRLVDTVRGSDLVARLGGDEFVLICEADSESSPVPEQIITRVRAAFDKAVATSLAGLDTATRTGVSIGAVLARPEDTAEAVLLRADAAMYDEKRSASVRRHRVRHRGSASPPAQPAAL